MRELTKADDLARELVQEVEKHLPQPESDSKVVEVTDELPAKEWWKFALYASYIQVIILADNAEFTISKSILEGFS